MYHGILKYSTESNEDNGTIEWGIGGGTRNLRLDYVSILGFQLSKNKPTQQ